MIKIRIKTSRRVELVNITAEVADAVRESGVAEGVAVVYVPHTTAGVTINEAADPDVAKDIERTLSRLVPEDGGYTHSEGNSDAHVKSALVGSSVQIPIIGGRLALGAWQGIFFCEFDGPRSREIYVTVLGR
jgi:secondary thiamine-phosphate synthase enzyme